MRVFIAAFLMLISVHLHAQSKSVGWVYETENYHKIATIELGSAASPLRLFVNQTKQWPPSIHLDGYGMQALEDYQVVDEFLTVSYTGLDGQVVEESFYLRHQKSTSFFGRPHRLMAILQFTKGPIHIRSSGTIIAVTDGQGNALNVPGSRTSTPSGLLNVVLVPDEPLRSDFFY